MSNQTKPTFMPSVDVYETEDSYEFIADMPGMDSKKIKEVLSVIIEKGQLKITGETYFQKPAAGKKVKLEYIEGKYQRIFNVGSDINDQTVSGKYIDGVLYLSLLKKKPVSSNVSINID